MNIALIIGHRKSSQGAHGNAGLSEFKYWQDMLQKVTVQANAIHGARVKLYTRQDKRGYTKNMIELHKRLDADDTNIAIECHFNGSSNKKVRGHEVFYYSKKGKRMAIMFNDRLSEYYNFTTEKEMPNRGAKRLSHKGQSGFQFVSRGKSVCILIEPFFSSHQYRFIKGTDGYDAITSAIFDFINDVAGLSKNPLT